jgi:hypothetical protein
MPNPFYSAQRTLERAKYHFRDFEARIKTFRNDKKWTYNIERDMKGRNNRHKIKFDRTFFDEAPSVVFDTINNLRAVLDQSVYASCIASKRPVNNHALFAFADEAAKIEKSIKGRSKDAPLEIQDIIRAFKPYKRGNVALWHLNALCNTKKHAILAPATFDPLGVQIHIGAATIGIGHKWIPENYEIEILGAGGADFSQADGLSFRIVFDHVESWIRHSEPLAILDTMSREVERVLMTIEAECRRIWPESFE